MKKVLIVFGTRPEEPNIDGMLKGFAADTSVLSSLEFALTRAKVVVLFVDRTGFKEMVLELICGKSVVDTRGTWTVL